MALKIKKGKEVSSVSVAKNNIGRPKFTLSEATDKEKAFFIKSFLESPKSKDNVFRFFDNTLDELKAFVEEHLGQPGARKVAKPEPTDTKETEPTDTKDGKKDKK